jgi:hypothetical protein
VSHHRATSRSNNGCHTASVSRITAICGRGVMAFIAAATAPAAWTHTITPDGPGPAASRGVNRSRPIHGRSSATKSSAASNCSCSSSQATTSSAASSGTSTRYRPSASTCSRSRWPASPRNHELSRSRPVRPGTSLGSPASSCRSCASSGVSASRRPVANPPWATSSVTHAGVPDTGVRDPTLTLPSAIPAMTKRHLTIFVSARATLVASWAAARLSNARWSWQIAYLDEAAIRGSSGIRYLIPHHANPGQTWRQDSNLRPPGPSRALCR